MIRALVAVCMVVLLAAPLRAQSGGVSGTIVDETGAAVPGATIQLAGPDRRALAVSGPDGRFMFSSLPSGTYQLAVTLVGFSQATREAAIGATTVDVGSITLALARLAELVVVSAAKVESSLIDAPATMSVLPGEVLVSSPAQNYGDLLRAVPGINVIQLSARDVNITNRQATTTLANSQIVLLDGRSLYLDFFGLVLWDFLPNNLNDVRQIEVIRGPASAVWGANALTGVVNIITKPPREAKGVDVSLSGGWLNRGSGSGVAKGVGGLFGANATYAEAPNGRWSYRVSAGYFNSDPLARPTGRIPLIPDPRDPTVTVGGALYPADSTGPIGTAYENRGTSQPKFDARVDQEIEGGRVTYEGGVAGTNGIIYTGLGPFDIQSGSAMGYARVGYSKAALKLSFFTNLLSAEAPNLLLVDPASGRPLQLDFSTQTYDFEAGHATTLGRRQALTYGGNVRRNNFDLTIAPAAENRTEIGGYLQDEIILDRVRVTVGGRVDKAGNLPDAVFSPRVAAVFKPVPDHSVRVSFNRAFRSPSVINNYLDTSIVVPTDLSGLAPLLPLPLRPAVAAPFPLVVKAVGSRLPIGSTPQAELKQESVTAYEAAYTGTFRDRTTVGLAFYVNDLSDSINFTQLSPRLDPYTPANPPPGWPLPPVILGGLAQLGIFLPRTAFTYLNLGPLRQKGVEASIDHRFNSRLTAFANYSWQGDPTILDDPEPYPLQELALPPTHRFNLGFNFDGPRYLGNLSLNYSDRGFWSDVLSSPFHGFTDPYTMVNGAFGVKWLNGRVTTSVKVNNIFNQDVRQHVFGDIIKQSGVFEVRFRP